MTELSTGDPERCVFYTKTQSLYITAAVGVDAVCHKQRID